MAEPSRRPRTVFKWMTLGLTFLAFGARAEEWVSVWTPPEPAVGGMESLVDATSIEVTSDLRRAKWRMVPWLRKDFADKVLIPSNVIKYIIVVSTFDCRKELMRDEQTTMYKGDGTNNAGAIGPSIWGKPAGATRAVFDFVCGTAH